MFTTIIVGLLIVSVLLVSLLIWKTIKQRIQLKTLTVELQQASAKYEKLSGDLNEIAYEPLHRDYVDSLTGLADRKIFEDRLLQAINHGNRLKTIFAVMTLDIDDLAQINKLGHDVGDKVLKEFSLRMQSSIRQVDTLTRFSGGCFVILLPHLSRAETAIYVAQRIQDSLIQTFKIDSYEITVKVSMGIAIFPIDGNDAKALLECAEGALRQAKKTGKNKYQFYQSAIQDLGTRELSLASLIRSPELYKKITVKYRPFFTTEDNVIYIQATKHLQHPEWGLLPFSNLTNIVENSGKTIEIKTWLVQNALTQLKKWHEGDFKPKHLGIQVSLHQLENPHLIYMLIEIMKETRGKIELVLEITDDVIHQNAASIEKIFSLLNAEGIKVAVGVIALGHFAMQKINRIPLNYLMIDAKITQTIIDANNKGEILRNIIELAKLENIIVMAEGVDTEQQRQVLSELGCELMEGKLFGYLMPTGKVLEKE